MVNIQKKITLVNKTISENIELNFVDEYTLNDTVDNIPSIILDNM